MAATEVRRLRIAVVCGRQMGSGVMLDIWVLGGLATILMIVAVVLMFPGGRE